MKKDFLGFIIEQEAPSHELKLVVQKDIQLSFRKNIIILKFIAFQVLGALFSLSFCPQFGLGLNPGHNISHYFMQFGMWACAAFCGSLFLSSGVLVAFLGMKGEELWWIWRRYKYSLVMLPVLLWAGLMLTNVSLSLPGVGLSFHLWWMTAAILSVGVLLGIRSKIFILRFTSTVEV